MAFMIEVMGRIGKGLLRYFPKFVQLLVIFATLTFSPSLSHATTGAEWEQATAAAGWSARQGFGNLVFNNKMWVLGGYDDDINALNDVWSSTDGVTWTLVTEAPGWATRSHFGAVVFNNKMWVIGGEAGMNLRNDVWSSTDGVTWTLATADAGLPAKGYFGAVVFNNKMWVIGGMDENGAQLNEVWSSTDGVTWTLVTANAGWAPRRSFGAVVHNGKMWVIGGYDWNMGVGEAFNDVWSSTNGADWTEVTDPDLGADWSIRYDHGAVVADGKMWVMGGWDDSNSFNDVWSSTDGDAWMLATDDAGWVPRDSFGAVVFANRIWVMGGWDVVALTLNSVWYSPLPAPPPDTTPPSKPVLSKLGTLDFTPGSWYFTDPTPTFRGTGEVGATIFITINSDPITGSTTVGSDGKWSYTLSVPIPTGEHTVSIYAKDAAENQSAIFNFSLTIDPTGAIFPPNIRELIFGKPAEAEGEVTTPPTEEEEEEETAPPVDEEEEEAETGIPEEATPETRAIPITWILGLGAVALLAFAAFLSKKR